MNVELYFFPAPPEAVGLKKGGGKKAPVAGFKKRYFFLYDACGGPFLQMSKMGPKKLRRQRQFFFKKVFGAAKSMLGPNALKRH